MRRNRAYFLLFLFMMAAISCGCSPRQTTNYIRESDRELPVKAADTTAPKGTFDNFFVVTNRSILLDAFGLQIEDRSEVTVGFRNCELVKNEEELADLFQKVMAESGKIQIAEALNIQWDLRKDTWEEKGASADSLKEEVVPEKDGLYRMEIIAVDIYGNATVMNSYALVDTTAPVISGAEDTQVVIKKDNNYENITAEGVTAEDNLLGDLTSQILISEEIIEEPDKDICGFKAKVTYTVADFTGNETVIERIMNFEFDKKKIVPEQQVVAEQSPVAQDGFNEEWAFELLNRVNEARASIGLHPLVWDKNLEEFAKVRAKEASVLFSHTRPDGSSVIYGENLAGNARSVNEVFNGWMNSPGHRSNIEHPQCTIFGAACYSVNNKYTWVQIFY